MFVALTIAISSALLPHLDARSDAGREQTNTTARDPADVGVLRPIGASAAAVTTTPDFDGDGFADLAVGVTGERPGSVIDGGALAILYGSINGVSARDQLISLATDGIQGTPQIGDGFATALAWGNFDGDAYTDIAVGAPGKDVGGAGGAGRVSILFGSSSGLGPRDQLWSQDSSGIQGAAEADDAFGGALAAGDFDNDGRDDLAIGTSGENLDGVSDAGVVTVLYGAGSGLTDRDQDWTQNASGVAGSVERGDGFGSALAAGDFDGDGDADLAIGAPGEVLGSADGAGMVNVLYGSGTGLRSTRGEAWHQGSTGIPGSNEDGDATGGALGTGDFNGDGRSDLAIGSAGETVNGARDAGAITVLYGTSAGGLSSGSAQAFHQDSTGVIGTAEAEDNFGAAFAGGDVNGDGFGDLAIGAPAENVGATDAGAVHILYGSASRLNASGDEFWSQDTDGIADSSQIGEAFGTTIAIADFDADGRADVAIGVPGEEISSIRDAGAVVVLYGSTGGATATGDELWHQDVTGIAGAPGGQAHFGGALAEGR